jgi:hypothetical protein
MPNPKYTQTSAPLIGLVEKNTFQSGPKLFSVPLRLDASKFIKRTWFVNEV